MVYTFTECSCFNIHTPAPWKNSGFKKILRGGAGLNMFDLFFFQEKEKEDAAKTKTIDKKESESETSSEMHRCGLDCLIC